MYKIKWRQANPENTEPDLFKSSIYIIQKEFIRNDTTSNISQNAKNNPDHDCNIVILFLLIFICTEDVAKVIEIEVI